MKNFLPFCVSCFFVVFLHLGCENEVEINGEFEETAVVYGLLDAGADTQFVRVNKTFLRDNVNALDLAKKDEEIYFENLVVSLIDDNNQEILLSEYTVNKESGLFSDTPYKVYITDSKINKNSTYRLRVVRPDGEVSVGETSLIDSIYVTRPNLALANNNSIAFVNTSGDDAPYTFIFQTGENVAEFEAVFNFHYIEIIINDSIPRKVVMPLTRFNNEELTTFREFQFDYTAEAFFRAIEAQIPTTQTKKFIPRNNNVSLEITAADQDYLFYRNVNGPIEGLAQTRPEYTNIENGIGLFTSKFSMNPYTRLNDGTRNALVSRYRDSRNLSN